MKRLVRREEGPMGLSDGSPTVSLQKGQKVELKKTDVITVTAEWSSRTDYDVLAEVLYKDGSTQTVAMFGTTDDRTWRAQTNDGAVKHLGDVRGSFGGGGLATESLTIRLNPDIVAVLPFVYSAQGNGTGSFRRYKVAMEVSNQAGDSVKIVSDNASRNGLVYTCVPAIIRQLPDGTVQIQGVKRYTRMCSEKRPSLTPNGKIRMHGGKRNLAK